MAHLKAKPESALKRAEELLALGHQDKALEVLQLAIQYSRKSPWAKIHEKVMLRFLDLCIDLMRSKHARDGLAQYRNQTQAQSIQSLEIVLKYFIEKSRQAASEAQQKAIGLASELEDLDDEGISAEEAILKAVSGEEVKARSERILDREIVTPRLKFLWETYRSVLDCIRMIPKLEGLYKMTTELAFQFCRDFKRTNEFRRLTDLLRSHLATLVKHQQAQLDTDAGMQFQLEIRISQLKTAAALGMWQDAFRTVEDISSLMQMYKKTPPPEMMITYYEKLAEILFVSENYAFHTYSLLKFYELAKELKRDEAFLRALASKVLISALAMPLHYGEEDDMFVDYDVQRERNARLAQWLGYAIAETKRDAVLHEVLSKDIHKNVYPELKNVYTLLEEKFAPLQMSKSLKSLLDFVKADEQLTQYYNLLLSVGFARLLQQLSQVYQSLKIDSLMKMLPFVSRLELEKMIVIALKNKHVEGRIDHRKGVITFGAQSFESESIRNSFITVARNLFKAIYMIHPERKAEEAKLKREEFARIAQGLQRDHELMLQRREKIQQVAKLRESLMEAEAERKRQADKAAKDAEEAAERERKRKREEDKLAQQKAQEEAAKRDQERRAVLERLSEIAPFLKLPSPESLPPEMEAAELATMFARKIIAEREKLERNLRQTAERLDHLVRARRERELPLLKAMIEEKVKEDKKYFEATIKAYKEHHRKIWEESIKEKQRVAKMQEDRKALENAIMAKRREIYEKLKKQQEERLAEKRRKEQERRAQLEAERKRKEEEERKKREEEEAKRREEERLRKEEEEKRKAELEKARAEEKKMPDSWRPRPAADKHKSPLPTSSRADEEASWRRPASEKPSLPPPARSVEGPWRKPPPAAPRPLERSGERPDDRRRPFEKPEARPSAADSEDSWRSRPDDRRRPAEKPEERPGPDSQDSRRKRPDDRRRPLFDKPESSERADSEDSWRKRPDDQRKPPAAERPERSEKPETSEASSADNDDSWRRVPTRAERAGDRFRHGDRSRRRDDRPSERSAADTAKSWRREK